MPRIPRLDFPGAKHHVMARGVARTGLFADDADRERMIRIAARAFGEGGTHVLAWAFMPNHVHWLIESGATHISRVFQRIHGAYAQGFNVRHERVGHLFQDRFASVRVDSDEYVLALLRYVHRNPLDGGVVRDLSELAEYPWTGYPAMLGRRAASVFHAVDRARGVIDEHWGSETQAIERLMADRAEPRTGPHALPGWLPIGGRAEFEALTYGVRGVLCTDADLATIVRETESRSARRAALRRVGWTTERIVGAVAQCLRIRDEFIRRGSRRSRACRGRAIVAFFACEHLGATRAVVAEETGVLPSAITHALRNGERYAKESGIDVEALLGL